MVSGPPSHSTAVLCQVAVSSPELGFGLLGNVCAESASAVWHFQTEINFLLLLRSQLYRWGSSFLVRFLRMSPGFFFNPTTEVASFHLRGCCMLGVFLLLAFTHLGHECQALLSPCDGILVCTDYRPRFILSSKRVLGNGVRAHANCKGKIPSTGGSEECGTREAASRRTVSPTYYRLSYSSPEINFQRLHDVFRGASSWACA